MTVVLSIISFSVVKNKSNVVSTILSVLTQENKLRF